jgi:hypothetical protein
MRFRQGQYEASTGSGRGTDPKTTRNFPHRRLLAIELESALDDHTVVDDYENCQAEFIRAAITKAFTNRRPLRCWRNSANLADLKAIWKKGVGGWRP